MAALVTLTQAKSHLRDPDAAKADLELKIEQASAIILDYLKGEADPAWDEDTVPMPVQAATLLMLGHLYEHRGDDMTPDDVVWNAIGRLLCRFRDPALA
jgi:gp6-like head-tail connector protein